MKRHADLDALDEAVADGRILCGVTWDGLVVLYNKRSGKKVEIEPTLTMDEVADYDYKEEK